MRPNGDVGAHRGAGRAHECLPIHRYPVLLREEGGEALPEGRMPEPPGPQGFILAGLQLLRYVQPIPFGPNFSFKLCW